MSNGRNNHVRYFSPNLYCPNLCDAAIVTSVCSAYTIVLLRISTSMYIYFINIYVSPSYLLNCCCCCFGFNGPLRQYFSLYRAVSQREGERGEKGQMREKISKQPPPAPTASATGPCPTIIQISRTPRHWKITQHHRTTRPPPVEDHLITQCRLTIFAEKSCLNL